MQADPQLAQFVASLDGHSAPLDVAGPLLGCWHALRGEWGQAHDAVQDDSAESAWVHAALHREERDHGNAAYWYRLANRAVAAGAARDEYLAIAAELLAR